jgi:hypothetical protein
MTAVESNPRSDGAFLNAPLPLENGEWLHSREFLQGFVIGDGCAFWLCRAAFFSCNP